MLHWLHHLLNPHCEQCISIADEAKVCKSCETLKIQLSIANVEKKQLLDSVLSFTKPTIEQQSSPVDYYEKLKPKMMTWNVRKQMLEAEDRKSAQLLTEQKQKKFVNEQITDLEKDVGIGGEVNPHA